MNKDLIKFYKKYRLFIYPAVVAVSSLILIIFVMIPQIGTFFKSARQESDFRVRSEFLDTKVSALESLDEAGLSRQVSDVLASLPGEKDFAGAIYLLAGLAKENGFTIGTLTLGAGSGTKSSAGESFGARMEALGPKSLLGRFLSAIESSPRLMRVTGIEISSARGGDTIEVSLAIEALFAPIPVNLGSVDSPIPQLSPAEEELIARLSGSDLPEPLPLSPTGKSDLFE
ncbi:hypothetical protein HYU96_02245 [Candidatus Daviesbacteria bacterium]|nr:hypothetical protein [Candidatus Daviesbacteria bacterium]